MGKKKEEEKLYICRPCGYVMKESELEDVCPACGLPRKVFVDYKERMSPGRNKILKLDLHPIAVHFPQTMLIILIQALLINLIFPHLIPEVFIGTSRFTAFVFPFAVFGAFVSGLVDGKLRFKSVTTPVLKMKIIYSSILFLVSLFTPYFAWVGIEEMSSKLWLLGLGTVALVCAVILGHAGKRLMNIGMGGAMKVWGFKL